MGVLDSLRAHVLACAVIDLTAWLFDHFQLERCSALRFVLSTVPIQVVSSGPKTLQDDDLRQNAPVGNNWEQLTFFTDSAVYPTLSRDGHMLAFIRGNDAFFGPGQVYVKFLTDGEPVQLTHDSTDKMSPAFSPDGSRIVYGSAVPWDTWEVPVVGGVEAHLMLPNASSLTWIEDGKGLLFSETREGLHMVVVLSLIHI